MKWHPFPILGVGFSTSDSLHLYVQVYHSYKPRMSSPLFLPPWPYPQRRPQARNESLQNIRLCLRLSRRMRPSRRYLRPSLQCFTPPCRCFRPFLRCLNLIGAQCLLVGVWDLLFVVVYIFLGIWGLVAGVEVFLVCVWGLLLGVWCPLFRIRRRRE